MIDCYFLILPGFLPLDLAGPLQVLLTANNDEPFYNIRYVSPTAETAMKGGLCLQSLQGLPAQLPAGCRLIIPGLSQTDEFMASTLGREIILWLKQQRAVENLTLATVCSGALIAAKAGWLAHKNCTTHHDLIARLRKMEPTASVVDNRLFVNDGNLWTSAGISSGIDLMLAFVQQDLGSAVTAAVAREMVIYFRRSGDDPQLSPWLSGRNHMNHPVHKVQDLICRHPEQNFSVEELAATANMSSRNLTRQFKRVTEQTIQDYREKIKLSHAEKLLLETRNSIESIAEACGFQSARSFRRAWTRYYSTPPSEMRRC